MSPCEVAVRSGPLSLLQWSPGHATGPPGCNGSTPRGGAIVDPKRWRLRRTNQQAAPGPRLAELTWLVLVPRGCSIRFASGRL